jgi:hypothetical protein
MAFAKFQTDPEAIQSMGVAQRNGSLIEFSGEGWVWRDRRRRDDREKGDRLDMEQREIDQISGISS